MKKKTNKYNNPNNCIEILCNILHEMESILYAMFILYNKNKVYGTYQTKN